MGTPWEGTPLMGGLADVAQIFGAFCGYNEDLTPQGATRWLRKIPLDKQKEVYYYTTSAGVSCYHGITIHCNIIEYRWGRRVKFLLRLYWMIPMMEQQS